ncbi:hypothetical protein JCM8202v2_000512 [Rhodotorula sphaerocarpa]
MPLLGGSVPIVPALTPLESALSARDPVEILAELTRWELRRLWTRIVAQGILEEAGRADALEPTEIAWLEALVDDQNFDEGTIRYCTIDLSWRRRIVETCIGMQDYPAARQAVAAHFTLPNTRLQNVMQHEPAAALEHVQTLGRLYEQHLDRVEAAQAKARRMGEAAKVVWPPKRLRQLRTPDEQVLHKMTVDWARQPQGDSQDSLPTPNPSSDGHDAKMQKINRAKPSADVDGPSLPAEPPKNRKRSNDAGAGTEERAKKRVRAGTTFTIDLPGRAFVEHDDKAILHSTATKSSLSNPGPNRIPVDLPPSRVDAGDIFSLLRRGASEQQERLGREGRHSKTSWPLPVDAETAPRDDSSRRREAAAPADTELVAVPEASPTADPDSAKDAAAPRAASPTAPKKALGPASSAILMPPPPTAASRLVAASTRVERADSGTLRPPAPFDAAAPAVVGDQPRQTSRVSPPPNSTSTAAAPVRAASATIEDSQESSAENDYSDAGPVPAAAQHATAPAPSILPLPGFTATTVATMSDVALDLPIAGQAADLEDAIVRPVSPPPSIAPFRLNLGTEPPESSQLRPFASSYDSTSSSDLVPESQLVSYASQFVTSSVIVPPTSSDEKPRSGSVPPSRRPREESQDSSQIRASSSPPDLFRPDGSFDLSAEPSATNKDESRSVLHSTLPESQIVAVPPSQRAPDDSKESSQIRASSSPPDEPSRPEGSNDLPAQPPAITKDNSVSVTFSTLSELQIAAAFQQVEQRADVAVESGPSLAQAGAADQKSAAQEAARGPEVPAAPASASSGDPEPAAEWSANSFTQEIITQVKDSQADDGARRARRRARQAERQRLAEERASQGELDDDDDEHEGSDSSSIGRPEAVNGGDVDAVMAAPEANNRELFDELPFSQAIMADDAWSPQKLYSRYDDFEGAWPATQANRLTQLSSEADEADAEKEPEEAEGFFDLEELIRTP